MKATAQFVRNKIAFRGFFQLPRGLLRQTALVS